MSMVLKRVMNLKENENSKKEYIKELAVAKEELDNAISNFSFVTEPELIDLYTYRIKAAQVKYNYCLNRVKKNIS